MVLCIQLWRCPARLPCARPRESRKPACLAYGRCGWAAANEKVGLRCTPIGACAGPLAGGCFRLALLCAAFTLRGAAMLPAWRLSSGMSVDACPAWMAIACAVAAARLRACVRRGACVRHVAFWRGGAASFGLTTPHLIPTFSVAVFVRSSARVRGASPQSRLIHAYRSIYLLAGARIFPYSTAFVTWSLPAVSASFALLLLRFSTCCWGAWAAWPKMLGL